MSENTHIIPNNNITQYTITTNGSAFTISANADRQINDETLQRTFNHFAENIKNNDAFTSCAYNADSPTFIGTLKHENNAAEVVKAKLLQTLAAVNSPSFNIKATDELPKSTVAQANRTVRLPNRAVIDKSEPQSTFVL